MDADFCRAVAGRTVVPRDKVIIMDAYECNRPMGGRKNTNEDVMGPADRNLFGGNGSAG